MRIISLGTCRVDLTNAAGYRIDITEPVTVSAGGLAQFKLLLTVSNLNSSESKLSIKSCATLKEQMSDEGLDAMVWDYIDSFLDAIDRFAQTTGPGKCDLSIILKNLNERYYA